jgi:hypothetical protein
MAICLFAICHGNGFLCLYPALSRLTLAQANNREETMDHDSQWKTEEYHDHDMRVLAKHRGMENPDLPGHGAQWDFTVQVTPHGAGPESAYAETARSDPAIFYSTQAIAENMGFLKGREIIEGRATAGAGPAGPGGQTL